MKKHTCRLCGHNQFKLVIDLGKSPLVNSLLTKEECGTEEVYQLKVRQCKKCFLVQIVNPVDSKKIYQEQDYVYYTGDMPQDSEYMQSFDTLVDEIQNRHSADGDFIVEIGSNDGTILKKFPNRKVLGVDPATNVCVRAIAKGIPTISAPFDERIATSIVKEFGKAAVVGGANCLAHIDDIHSVLKGVEKLLKETGIFWAEVNYWGGMVKHGHYALIYHDHYSYFTLQNWIDLLSYHGMEVFDAYLTPAQGQDLSLRLFAGRGLRPKTEAFLNLLKSEQELNLGSLATGMKFRNNALEKAKILKETADNLRNAGKRIAGYGAAAKGFSILQLAGIGAEYIEYFVDDSPAKQGKFTPVTHIPVISRTEAETKLPDVFFITAPNYAKVIMRKEQDFMSRGGKFLLADGELIG